MSHMRPQPQEKLFCFHNFTLNPTLAPRDPSPQLPSSSIQPLCSLLPPPLEEGGSFLGSIPALLHLLPRNQLGHWWKLRLTEVK